MASNIVIRIFRLMKNVIFVVRLLEDAADIRAESSFHGRAILQTSTLCSRGLLCRRLYLYSSSVCVSRDLSHTYAINDHATYSSPCPRRVAFTEAFRSNYPSPC